MAFVDRGHAVARDECVAIAPGVHLVDDKALVFFIFFGDKLLRTEDVGQRLLVGLFHSPFEFASLFFVHAADVDAFHLDFLVFHDVDVEHHAVLGRHVFFLGDGDFGVFEAFFVEIALDVDFGAVHHIGRDLVANLQAEALFEVFALTLFHTRVVDA